ncbi:hypothetical protein [Pseudomonas mandelii]|uniref:hypothetical protein n=1 Tax=Pseudomonas mandelii TaxID=75612 RepID=UPI00209F918C|nr:hypothetical protein [Pseudomonas mandelii]MCO8310353.1 hypothetical protein [Pseudomonas mandelii]
MTLTVAAMNAGGRDVGSALARVGAAEGCDLLILLFYRCEAAEDQDQKIAAFGSSYRGMRRPE